MPKPAVVKVVDSRIQPQESPTYAVTIGPDQNQWYKITASGLSQSSVTFNNLTTLGKDRAYLDSFELEISCLVTCKSDLNMGGEDQTNPAAFAYTFDGATTLPIWGTLMPQSFPFNSCCEQIRTNINGGAFFSNPMYVIRAIERYWDQEKLNRSYANHTPCQKPMIQDELGVELADIRNIDNAAYISDWMNASRTRLRHPSNNTDGSLRRGENSCTNFDIMHKYEVALTSTSNAGGVTTSTFRVTWREPIICPPFSSRYDATYGRPLYNITSIDLTFTLGDLRRMFILASGSGITDFNVTLDQCMICYQVMTVTAPILKNVTVVPYRRFVPYVTDFPSNPVKFGKTRSVKTLSSGVYTLNEIPTAIWVFIAPSMGEYQNLATSTYAVAGGNIQQQGEGQVYNATFDSHSHTLTSQCVEFNPVTDTYSRYAITQIGASNYGASYIPPVNGMRITNNNLFGFIRKVSINCGNTTQILNTASPWDLYRIAKANGCQDTYRDFSAFYYNVDNTRGTNHKSDSIPDVVGCTLETNAAKTKCVKPNLISSQSPIPGAGSCLRLIPGVDIVLPDQRLIPGANGNSLVFQAEVDFEYFGGGDRDRNIALWLLFEYVGEAAIAPGQCQVTMNPLGDGKLTSAAPVVTSSQIEDLSTTDGSGWLDILKNLISKGNKVAKNTKIVSRILGQLGEKYDWAKQAGEIASKLGYGYGMDDEMMDVAPPTVSRGKKRGRAVSGGAVMGLGDFC